MSKRTPGLYFDQKAGEWVIDKRVSGVRIFERTGERSQEEAQAILDDRIHEARLCLRFGETKRYSFREAATHYVKTETKRSIDRDFHDLKMLDPWIGHLFLDQISDETLKPFKDHRMGISRRRGPPFDDQGLVKSGTVNRALATVHRVLVLCARRYRDNNKPWLTQAPPEITKVPETDKRPPYPLSWIEQDLFFDQLPEYLRDRAMFAVHTGARDAEVCNLRWTWEVEVSQIHRTGFLIPADYSKNKTQGLLVLNKIAEKITDTQRGQHPDLVFPGPKGGLMDSLLTTSWVRARKDAAKKYNKTIGLEMPDRFASVSPHDLRHSFGQRLRAVGVGLEDRRDLLRHRKADVTEHYSAAELAHLFDCVDLISAPKSRKSPALLIIKNVAK